VAEVETKPRTWKAKEDHCGLGQKEHHQHAAKRPYVSVIKLSDKRVAGAEFVSPSHLVAALLKAEIGIEFGSLLEGVSKEHSTHLTRHNSYPPAVSRLVSSPIHKMC